MARIYTRIYNGKTHYCITYSIEGRRVLRRIGTNEKEARRVLREIERMIAVQDPVLFAKIRSKGISLEDYCEEYLEWSQARKSPAGYERDQTICSYLVDGLCSQGVLKLREVQPVHLERHLTWLKSQASSETANRHWHTIRHLFNHAVHTGYLVQSPAARVKEFPQVRRHPPRFFTLAWISTGEQSPNAR